MEQKYGSRILQSLTENRAGGEVKMNIIYYPSVNEFRGEQQLQFVMQNWN